MRGKVFKRHEQETTFRTNRRHPHWACSRDMSDCMRQIQRHAQKRCPDPWGERMAQGLEDMRRPISSETCMEYLFRITGAKHIRWKHGRTWKRRDHREREIYRGNFGALPAVVQPFHVHRRSSDPVARTTGEKCDRGVGIVLLVIGMKVVGSVLGFSSTYSLSWGQRDTRNPCADYLLLTHSGNMRNKHTKHLRRRLTQTKHAQNTFVKE